MTWLGELVHHKIAGREVVDADDAILAGVLRRFIHDPDRHEAHDPFVWDDNGSLVLDGRIDITPEESAAIAAVRSAS